MPPKTCHCSICGLEVLKSTTYALADGTRACKTHPDVEADANTLRLIDFGRRKNITRLRYLLNANYKSPSMRQKALSCLSGDESHV